MEFSNILNELDFHGFTYVLADGWRLKLIYNYIHFLIYNAANASNV